MGPTKTIHDHLCRRRYTTATSPAMRPSMSSSPPPSTGPTSPQTTTDIGTVPLLLPVLVLICFFSVFLLRDLLRFLSRRGSGTHGEDVDGAHKDVDSGLDPAIIATFPTMAYSSAREVVQEGNKECAVCLGEFSGGDVIRLLTVCCHVFHPQCIDSWLTSHTTCPMCRSDLCSLPVAAHVVLDVRDDVADEEEEEVKRQGDIVVRRNSELAVS